MRRIEIEELKDIQLEILKKTHDFCCKNNIHYSLAYGTLIGAIRHKGYIPWDDDIDIMMPRKDYVKFVMNFNGVYKDLRVVSPISNKHYYAPYSNVVDIRTILEEENQERSNGIGIKIDIFPIDHVSDDLNDRRLLYKRVNIIKLLIDYKNKRFFGFTKSKHNIISLIAKPFLRFIPITYYLDQYASYQNQKNSNSMMVNNIVWCAAGERACFSNDAFNSFIDVTFERFEFKVLEGYDLFLRAHYGDYMSLPPIEKRIPYHGFRAYWKD